MGCRVEASGPTTYLWSANPGKPGFSKRSFRDGSHQARGQIKSDRFAMADVRGWMHE
jgi:hypothetical protein